MPLLPPHYLKAVVAVGTDGLAGERTWVASGFLYFHKVGQDDSGASTYHPFLVTNRHVVEGLNSIYIRANLATGGTREYPVLHETDAPASPRRFFFHPDPEVDLAVTSLNYDYLQSEGLDAYFFETDNDCALPDELQGAGILEGDLVFVAGFPMGLIGRERDTPIIRLGCISRIREVYDGDARQFLVDASVFPGNSGGPVILRPQAGTLTGPTDAVKTAWVIGIVESYLPYTDEAVSTQTGLTRIVFQENSGLVGVIPISLLTELADQAILELRHIEDLASEPAQDEGSITSDPDEA